MTTETELRDRLHSAAWRGATGGDDLVAADAVIARRHGERRQRTAVLATAACGVLIAVLVPVVGARWLTARAPASPAGPTAGTPSATDLWRGPPRGSLAGDRAFLRAALRLTLPGGGSSGPAPVRTVVFAGDAGGVRWVLVAESAAGHLTGHWFTGPAGTAADALTPEGQDDLNPRLAVGHVHAEATGASMLVLADPGDEVQVSPGVLVDAGGKVHRDYASVPAADGVAVVHETGDFAGVAVRFRVLHDGYLAGSGPSGTAGGGITPDVLSTPGLQTPRRPSTGSAPAPAVMNAMEQVLAPTGLAPGEVHPVLLWTGSIPLADGGSADAVVLALTMPSGAVVTTTAFGSPDPTVTGSSCGTAIHPAGTALDSLIVVARCDTSRDTGGHQSFVISAPPGYDLVMLRSSDGVGLVAQTLVNGSAIARDSGAVATATVSGPSASPLQVTVPQHDPLDVN